MAIKLIGHGSGKSGCYLGCMKLHNPNNEPYRPQGEEDLRLENELLKIKMQAEHGAQFGGDMHELPPEIENQWLKQMMAFEDQLAKEPTLTLAEHLGHPECLAADQLDGGKAIDAAWQALKKLLFQKGIEVAFLTRDLPARQCYDFVVQELFPKKMHPPMMDGQFLVFTYEEFHPDHLFDMEERVHELFQAVSLNKVSPDDSCMAATMITQDGRALDSAAFADKVQAFHEQFAAVGEFHYSFSDRSRQNAEEEIPESDLGFVEGMMQYEVTHRDGTKQMLEGPFKVYLQYQFGWWSVFFFHLYGFSWS